MMIQWREELSIDNGVIDEDHKTLINIFNAFTEATRGKIDLRRINKLLDDLVAYTALHFKREEMIQRKIQFPLMDQHVKEHQALIAKLDEMIRRFQLMVGGMPDERFISELGNLLTTWLVDHIVKSDRTLKPYLQKHQADLGTMRSLTSHFKQQQQQMAAGAPASH